MQQYSIKQCLVRNSSYKTWMVKSFQICHLSMMSKNFYVITSALEIGLRETVASQRNVRSTSTSVEVQRRATQCGVAGQLQVQEASPRRRREGASNSLRCGHLSEALKIAKEMDNDTGPSNFVRERQEHLRQKVTTFKQHTGQKSTLPSKITEKHKRFSKLPGGCQLWITNFTSPQIIYRALHGLPSHVPLYKCPNNEMFAEIDGNFKYVQPRFSH